MPPRRKQEMHVEAHSTWRELCYIVALVCGTIILICGMIVFAPQADRLLLLAQELAEIIMIQGVGGAFHTVFTAATMAMNRLYADFSIHKLVLFVAVAVIVRQFPRIVDNVISMLSEPPK